MRQRIANVGVLSLSGLLVAGLFAASAQEDQLKARSLEAAANYSNPVSYTAPESAPVVAFVGDSYTSGAEASSRSKRWTTVLSREMGWIELNYGDGGTNYGTAGQLRGARAYTDRLTDLIISQPDIVVVSTAGNTLNVDQVPGMKETFGTLRTKLPEARIIALSPFGKPGDYREALVPFGEDIEREVEAVGGEYVDVGHPLGTRNDITAEDDIHPNDTGYRLLAEAVADALTE